ncbi:hypothetical protein Pcinc_032776 [Petrolisthes cinctipes]|uniref:Uncharacterized protein n=1 Tax=Petrolisthes cinctipes TaxID=88211 RepID=A0AAE1ETU0_PETCI|nr:hypothetical protein Pcinc_032776 [Petrolisthes cinctipes]
MDCYDGSDEWHCQPDDFVQCGSGKRIHRHFWCDGLLHCDDNHADEANCTAMCGPGEYRCASGRCIHEGHVCDGLCDCLDCEDEHQHHCHHYYTTVSGM